MLEVLEKCFPHMEEWEPKIKEMIPSYGMSLAKTRPYSRKFKNQLRKR